jgi:hypothetical protein
MKTKKIQGFMMLIFAAASSLLLLNNLTFISSQVNNLGVLFTGTLSSYDAGRVVGASSIWILHLALTVACWFYGYRWVTSKSKAKVS